MSTNRMVHEVCLLRSVRQSEMVRSLVPTQLTKSLAGSVKDGKAPLRTPMSGEREGVVVLGHGPSLPVREQTVADPPYCSRVNVGGTRLC